MKNSRVNKILEGMAKEGLSQMIITSPASIFYLTGKWIYPGERMIALYINQNGDHKLVINKLFPVYEDLGVEMIWYEDTENPIDYLNRCINKNEILGIDKDWPARFLIQLINSNAAKGFVNGSPIIDRVRMIKDAEEIEIMKASSKINDAVMLKLWDNLKVGKSEKYYAGLFLPFSYLSALIYVHSFPNPMQVCDLLQIHLQSSQQLEFELSYHFPSALFLQLLHSHLH